MKFFTLVHKVPIQGNVCVKIPNDNPSLEKVYYFDQVESLAASVADVAWKNKLGGLDVLYMFCPDDGYLHIELGKEIKGSDL